jgi:cell division protein FtsL
MAKNTSPLPDSISIQSRRLGQMSLRAALGLLVIVMIAGLVGWVYLSQASEATETERRIRELRLQKEELQRQTDQLTYEVAQLASVEQLTKRARDLGYVPVWQPRFLTVVGYPTQDDGTSNEQTALSHGSSAGHATPSAVAGWWEAVTDQFVVWARTDQP